LHDQVPEARAEGGGQRERDNGRHAEEHLRRHFPLPSVGADHASAHVLVDALAQQDREPVIPALEHRVQDLAALAPGPGQDEDSE
jgi:hypothetical protein